MAKITITIEDSEDGQRAEVKMDKDTPGPLMRDSESGAEQIAFLLACLLQEAALSGEAN